VIAAEQHRRYVGAVAEDEAFEMHQRLFG